MDKIEFKKISSTSNHRSSLRKILTSLMILVIAFSSLAALLRQTVEAAWFDDSWAYRQKVIVTNSSGSLLTNFQISISLDTRSTNPAGLISQGKMRSACEDIRITDINGLSLPYWIEEGSAPCDSSATKIWTKAPVIPTGTSVFYVYYGNPSAASAQSGTNVFDFFDDFNSSFNDSIWSTTGSSVVTGGQLSVTTGAVYSISPAVSNAQNMMFETRSSWSSNVEVNGSGLTIANASSTQGGNAGSNKTVTMLSIGTSGGLPVVGYAANGTAASYNIISNGSQYTAALNTPAINGFSLDSSTLKYYKDGTQLNSYSGTFTGSSYIFLGNNLGSGAGVLDGKDSSFDWVRARKFTTTMPTTANSNEEKTTGPLTYLKFDEGVGGTAFDASGNGNNGSFRNYTTNPTALSKLAQTLNISSQSQSLSGSAMAPTDNSLGLVNYTAANYTNPTAYLEGSVNVTPKSTNQTVDVGAYTSVYCVSSTDCKIAYQDATQSALKFADCNDATCSAPTINTLDGAVGCTISGCVAPTGSTSHNTGGSPSIDCTGGSSDCKIAYQSSGTGDFFFIDCDDAACSTGTRTLLDGGAGCVLTGCSTTNTMGSYISLDCSQGASSCKITDSITTTGDIEFVSCANATCSSGSRSIVDGVTGCTTTGCVNTTDSLGYTSLDCSTGATDCKISYADITTGDLLFVDCDDATCSSGTRSLLDGNTGCTLTSCNTTANVGTYASVDCTGGTSDCKILYYDTTNTASEFVDCANATCTSGTITVIDGNTGCTVTGCSTSDGIGEFGRIDCSGGASDCKLVYGRNNPNIIVFVDCDTATCSTGTRTVADEGTGCAITGCITSATAGSVIMGMDCRTGAGDCKIVYKSGTASTNSWLALVDCDTAACSSGTKTKLDGSIHDIGTELAMTCVTTTDCKILYADTTSSSLKLFDCDDASCSTGTTTILDGAGCVISGCSSTATGIGITGSAIDCSGGSTDCKIVYYAGSTLAEIYFLDCDNSACSSGTRKLLDGGGGCTLTGCSTTNIVGIHPSIDCSQGVTDCKISYYNQTTGDLNFANCDDATCSTGTRTVVDGAAGCTVTGCTNTNTGQYSSLDCSGGATDCKISYQEVTNNDLYFVDCDDATCSSGTRSLLDGNTGCVLTGCSTTASVGQYSNLDCSAGTSDCKIAYNNSTGGDAYFVDCDNAVCGTGTTTIIRSTSNGGQSSVYCGGSSTDCKIASFSTNGAGLDFLDCDNSTCSSNTTTILDGFPGCTISGCSSDVAYTFSWSGFSCIGGVTNCQITYFNSNSGKFYFVNCSTATCASGTTRSEIANNPQTYIRLYTSAGVGVGDVYSTSNTSGYATFRVPETLVDGTDYTVRAYTEEPDFVPAGIQSTRLVIEQTGSPITSTQSQIEVGSAQSAFNNTTYANLTNSPIYVYTPSFSGNITINFEASLRVSSSSRSVSAQLLECNSPTDCSGGTAVAGSQITQTGSNTWTRKRTSSPITLSSNEAYVVQVKIDNATANGSIANAKIIITQTQATGIIATASYIPMLTSTVTDNDSTYTSQGALLRFDPSVFDSGNWYYESTIKTSAGTGYTRLYNTSDASLIASSELTATSSAYVDAKSGNLTMPGSTKTLDVQIKNASTDTTTQAFGWLIFTYDQNNSPTRQNEDNCISGKCLSFNGNTDYVYFGSAITNSLSSFTKELWFNPNGRNDCILSELGQSDINAGYHYCVFALNGNVLSGSLYNGSSLTTITMGTIVNSRWYHAAITFDGATVAAYLNGVQVGSSSTSYVGPSQLYFGIGAADSSTVGAGSGYFQGKIDEFKSYNYARPSDQIKADYIKGAGPAGSSAVLGLANQSLLSNGLAGYWKLDEISGDAADSSGNGTGLTNSGSTSFTAGKFGNGADLESTSSQYFSANDNSVLSITGDLTLSAWIKPESVTSSTLFDIVGKMDGANESYLLAQFGAELRFYIDSSSNYVTTNAAGLSTGTWYHVDAVYNANSALAKIYVNGIELTTTTTGTIPNSIGDDTGKFQIGAEDSSTTAANFYDGLIDDVRVYNRAFTPKEISSLNNSSLAPVAYWNFDENTGSTANDISTNTNNAALTSALWASGKYGAAASFSGTSSYGTVPDSNSLDLSNNFTLEAWVNPSSLSNSRNQIVMKNDSNTNFYGMNIDNTGLIRIQASGVTPSTAVSTGTVSVGNWTHIVGTYDGSNIRIYINGVLDSITSASGGNFTPITANLDIARDSVNAGRDFAGKIDELKIYNYARDESGVIEDINSNHPIGGSPIGSQLIYWKLDEQNGSVINNSGNGGPGYNGTASNTSWLTNTTCKVNGCLNFDATTDNISAGSPTVFDGLTNMSVSLWLNPQSIGSNSSIVSKYNGTDNSWQIRTVGTNQLRFVVSNAATDTSSCTTSATNVISTGSWQYFTFTYDGAAAVGDNIKIYKNGVLLPCNVSGTIPAAIRASTSALQVGTNAGSGAGLVGYYDEIKIYNATLTPEQIYIDYNQGASINYGTGTGLESAILTDGAGNYPALYWPLDENTGTSTADKSGSGNNGTLTAGPTWIPGKVGSALSFDGVDDYVTVPSASALNVTGDMTVSFWAKPGATQLAYADIFSKHSGGNSGYVFEQVGSNTNQYLFGWGNGTSFTCVSVALVTLTADAWQYVTLVKSGAVVTAYINGSAVNSCTGSGATIGTNTNALMLSRWSSGGGRFWNGSLDDFKIYNYARTQSQVAYDYNRGLPTAWWRMDECQGLTLNDASGSGHSATINIGGSGSYTSAGTCNSGIATEGWNAGSTGKINSALGFDGTDDYATMSAVPTTFPMTLTFWVNPAAITNDSRIIGSRTAVTGNDFWGVRFWNGTYELWDGTAWLPFTNNVASTNTWQFVAVTVDSALAYKGYFNGGLESTGTAANTGTWNVNLAFGSPYNGSGVNYSGLLDDVRIYNYALSQAQIQQVMNNGAVTFAPQTGAP